MRIMRGGMVLGITMATNAIAAAVTPITIAGQLFRRNSLPATLWLRLAQGWASLLTTRPQTAQESFDEQVADKGTGRDENKSQN
jgi:hypothetical protein